MPITITASFRLEWTEAPGAETEKPPVSPQEPSKYTSTVSIFPGYCPKCRKKTALSDDYERKDNIPHDWACQECGFSWEHHGAYIGKEPETPPPPLRTWPCPACRVANTECTNLTAPHGEPRRWRCTDCSHEFTVSDGWE